MIQIKTKDLNKVIKSKKDFFFYDTDDNDTVINFVLTNDFKTYKKLYSHFRVVSTIQKEYEFLTIK